LYHVLQLAAASRCTAYDCEYVALAYALDVPLVTVDRQILSHFPERAIALNAMDACTPGRHPRADQ
jgi:predicted nucleic acid-binding protein